MKLLFSSEIDPELFHSNFSSAAALGGMEAARRFYLNLFLKC